MGYAFAAIRRGDEGGYRKNVGSIGLAASRQPCALRPQMAERFKGLVVGQHPADDRDIQNHGKCQQCGEERTHHVE